MSNINVTEAALRRKQGAKWNAYPPNILPAWVADMDFNVAEPIRRALSDQISNSDFGYVLELGRIVMEGDSKELLEKEDKNMHSVL